MESCTILTTACNTLMQPIHDRMPVIIAPAYFDQWLAPEITIHQKLEHLLKPYPSEKMYSHPVSPIVNTPKNDSPECLKAITLEEPGLFDLE
ncbi:MAG: SOS response-associated peptidase [Phycisphaerae bacterium]|nr:SOS response-associated peptidase [Phycisphaerae bacterium]